jgi:hypothetical protein
VARQSEPRINDASKARGRFALRDDTPSMAGRYFSVRLSAEGAMRVTEPLLPRTTIR